MEMAVMMVGMKSNHIGMIARCPKHSQILFRLLPLPFFTLGGILRTFMPDLSLVESCVFFDLTSAFSN